MVRYIAENEEELRTWQEPPPTGYLVLLVEGRASHAFPLRGEIKLGRDKSNAIVLADQKVSRHHLTLTPIDTTFIVSDQGSANGTYLNGVLIAQPTRLKNNDRIGVGDTTFLFTTSQPNLNADSPPPPPVSAPPPAPSPRPLGQAALPAISEQTIPVWTLIGCMALIIVTLLFVVAMLLGLFMGQNQPAGLALLWLIQSGPW